MSRTPMLQPESFRERLRALWRGALDLDDEWSEQATFIELGGYSLLALSLAAEIGDALGVEVPRTLILEHQTFAAVATWLETTAVGARRPTADPPPRPDHSPPSRFRCPRCSRRTCSVRPVDSI